MTLQSPFLGVCVALHSSQRLQTKHRSGRETLNLTRLGAGREESGSIVMMSPDFRKTREAWEYYGQVYIYRMCVPIMSALVEYQPTST